MKLKYSLLIIVLLFINSSAQENHKVYTHPSWSYNQSIYEANIRQFSEEGTFNKFREYVPELKEMGIGIIWLMPVNPIGEKNRKGTLGSYYSIKDYLDVNPEFGTKEDFKNLVDEIHRNGMYVIIDWVANHSSWDNDLTEKHPEWYTKDSAGNFVPPVADWSDVIDLNYDNQGLREYMTDALLYWVKEFDIDGYRCDVAEMVPLDFWINARKELEKIKPVFMLAEGEKADLHEAFDMTYSWEIYNIMKDIFKNKKTAADLYLYLTEEKIKYPEDAFRMRFITNHDENSWNGTDYELFGEGVEAFSALSITIPGMPLIYSGQEAGLDKRLEFFEKDPIRWKEHRLREVYSNLLNMKKNNSVLYNGIKGGDFLSLEITGEDKIFSFMRKNDKEKLFAIFNLSGKETSVKISNEYLKGFYKNPDGTRVTLENTSEFNLAPWEYRVLLAK
jgi:cyclomaltodextrinase / maltogenic alpha-amylase / neopullulanase